MDRFPQCLAATLREEEGDEQPVGGPYKRGRFAYSDDPDDTGGKTMMGILQREYDAWRRNHGLPQQWVKYITDDEITAIYRDQFWRPILGDKLPPGVDLVVWDAGVNCGVNMAAKKLQKVLGLTMDGHVGQITIDAANRADQAQLIKDFSDAREAYHRQIKTFWKFGKGWIERTQRVETKALAMVDHVPVALAMVASEPVDYAERGHSETYTMNARAPAPEPAPPVATEATVGGVGVGGIMAAAPGIMERSTVGGKFNFWTFLAAVLSDPVVAPLLWVSVIALVGSLMFYLHRRKLAA